ncbi:MAG: FAD binding domain-containing protein [Deltaproteobacteria bacterium]|nr:FAD binding domain-containing protein [Deltaproteobacteria bacterium]
MRLPPFQFLEPTNVEEALSMMNARKETLKIMAGGTDLLNRMRFRLIEPAFVMNIGKLRDVDGIDIGENETVIGTNTKLKDIARSPLINNKFRAIAEAAFEAASPAVTNMATIGGNILQDTRCLYYNQSGMVLNGLERCHKRGGTICLAVKGGKRCFSVCQSDMAPALIAFDAKCVLQKKGSTRTVALTELFTGNGVTPFAIGADELLTKIIIPQPKNGVGSAYRKLRLRGSVDYPLASAAAFVSVTKDGEVNACRVVLGSAGASPRVIDGRSCETHLESIAQKAYDSAEGIDNLQMPGAYRRKMAGVLAKRAIKAAMDRLKEGM